jgi:DNA polymerase-1
LSYLAKEQQIVRDILEWRQMVKLQSTYIDALPNQVDKKTGRVHTDYMQTVAATGRLSSNNPNFKTFQFVLKEDDKLEKHLLLVMKITLYFLPIILKLNYALLLLYQAKKI